MPALEVWIAMSEDGGCEVATDEATAIENLKHGSDDDLTGTVCRIVKLNVTMSESFDENGSGAAVDVKVPHGAGCVVEIELD
jgi:hypothetical protein